MCSDTHTYARWGVTQLPSTTVRRATDKKYGAEEKKKKEEEQKKKRITVRVLANNYVCVCVPRCLEL